jgi:hypothetical protein
VRFVCLVGSSEDGLRLWLRLSSVPGCARPSCRRLWAGTRHHRLQHQEGVVFATKWSTWALPENSTRMSQLLRLGMGWVQSDIAPTPQQLQLRPSGGHASEEPGTVAMAARSTVATSEGVGRPSRQSRQERLAYNQYSFMLPLEVVGPGGSLSTVLVATPHWRDASRRVSWQAATATVVYCCDQTTTALTHRLRTAGGGGGGVNRFRRRRILNLFCVLVIRPFFFVLLFNYVFRLFYIGLVEFVIL